MIDIVGQQLRIRINEPSKFSSFRIKDIGRKGKFMIVVGKVKGKEVWAVQSLRFNLKDYSSIRQLSIDLNNLKFLNKSKRLIALKKASNFFKTKR